MKQKDCRFIATNTDLTYPANGCILPGTGALVNVLSSSLGKEPIVIGKPQPTMLQVILSKYHLDPASTLMVGDRLDTDILFGQQGGLHTCLVLTGVSRLDDIGAIKPDHVVDSLVRLLD